MLESLEGRALLSTIVVNTVKDSTDPLTSPIISLRDAITQANSSKVPVSITFDPKVFATLQKIVLGGSRLIINNSVAPITITGPSAGVNINGNQSVGDFVVWTNTTATLSGLTITGGWSGNGAGVDCYGTVTLYRDTISGNYAPNGGGIFNSGVAILIDTTVSYNTGGTGGGIWNTGGGRLSLTNVTVAENKAGTGGGIYNGGGGGVSGGIAELNSTTIAENQSSSGSGSGVFNSAGATVRLANTIIAGNLTVTSLRGPVYGPDVTGPFSSKGYNLIGATNGGTGWLSSDLTGTLSKPLYPKLTPLANYGGPTPTILLQDGSLAIDHGSNALASTITTDQRGLPRIVNGTIDIGAMEMKPLVVNTTSDLPDGAGDKSVVSGPSAFGALSLRQAIAIANLEPDPTAITFDTKVFASKQTITLDGSGLKIANANAPITITGPSAGVVISGNNLGGGFDVGVKSNATLTGMTMTASHDGGVTNNGTVTLVNDTFSGNTAEGGACVTNTGVAILIGDTISGNSASYGGGIWNGVHGNLSVANSTIANNSSKHSNGGGIYNAGTAELRSTTIVGNSAVSGGGVYNESTGTVKLVNTIIAKNVLSSTTGVGPDVYGTFASTGYNLIGMPNGSRGWLTTDLTGTLSVPFDPKLSVLGNNGGPTQTMVPQPGSPALKRGSVALARGISIDQRGLSRVVKGSIDIGAVEVQ